MLAIIVAVHSKRSITHIIPGQTSQRGKKDFRCSESALQPTLQSNTKSNTQSNYEEEKYIVGETKEGTYTEDAGWVRIGDGTFGRQSLLKGSEAAVESAADKGKSGRGKRRAWPWEVNRDDTFEESNR